MFQAFRMFDGRQSPWPMLLASGAAVVLLACSAFARADNCAGGADATGNDCTGGQAMSVRELSEADSHLLYLRGQAALAELRAARAKQRMLDAAAKVKATTKRRAAQRPRLPANRQRSDHQTIALKMTADKSPPRAASLRLADAAPRKPGAARSRKRIKMPRRAKPLAKANATGIERPAAPSQNTPAITGKPEIAANPTSARAAPRRKAVAKSRKPAANGRVYIIIEGQTASIVDEQGLMMHLFSNNAKNTRYFEASEVEARVQIMPKR